MNSSSYGYYGSYPSYATGDLGSHWYLYPTAAFAPTLAYDLLSSDDKKDSGSGGSGGGSSDDGRGDGRSGSRGEGRHRHHRKGRGDDGTDWTTIALVGGAVVGTLALFYVLKHK